MSTILVLTDFSDLAKNAADYAAALAKETGSSIELVHIYEWPMVYNGVTPEIAPLYMPDEEIRKGAETRLNAMADSLRAHYPGVAVGIICQPGNAIEIELEVIAENKKIFAIVTGVHELEGIDVILGSTPFSLIKQTKHTVIGVPATYTQPSFSKAVIATDLKPMKTETKNRLVEFLQEFNSEVELVYVKTPGGKEDVSATSLLRDLAILQPYYKTIESDDVKSGLADFLRNEVADLLVVLPHHHNLFESLFSKSHAKELLQGMKVPVAAIPEG